MHSVRNLSAHLYIALCWFVYSLEVYLVNLNDANVPCQQELYILPCNIGGGNYYDIELYWLDTPKQLRPRYSCTYKMSTIHIQYLSRLYSVL